MAFNAGERQMEWGNRLDVGTVEVRFNDSKDDNGGKGAVLVSVMGDWDKGVEAVELLQELYQIL